MSQFSKDLAYNTPANWFVVSNDGTNISAKNYVTGHTFSGTPAQFSEHLKEPKEFNDDPGSSVRWGRVGNGIALLDPSGIPVALSERLGYPNHLTASSVVTLSELAGWICTVAAGDITIYYGANSSGQILMPTTALTSGPRPIMGVGHNGKLPILGEQIYVLLSNSSARVSIIPGS
jgi:hypothetical protein